MVALVVVGGRADVRSDRLAAERDAARLTTDELRRELAASRSLADDAGAARRRLEIELASQRDVAERALADSALARRDARVRAEFLAADPTSRRTTLRDSDGVERAAIVVSPRGEGYVVASNLEPLPPGQTYQLWGVHDGSVLSVGVLGPEVSVAPFSAAPGPDGSPFEQFVLTVEPGAGVVSSVGEAVASGQTV
jgi:hypothetical protein